MVRPPPTSPLFPYTTLFRSGLPLGLLLDRVRVRRRVLAGTAVSREQLGLLRLCPLRSEVRSVLPAHGGSLRRSEEHTSELQSRLHLVCRLLLEKKNYDEKRS